MDFIKTLTDIVGEPNITASPVDCLAYSRDMSIHMGIPHAIVFAKDTQQVSEIMKLANWKESLGQPEGPVPPLPERCWQSRVG